MDQEVNLQAVKKKNPNGRTSVSAEAFGEFNKKKGV